jgi:hypothetical protein
MEANIITPGTLLNFGAPCVATGLVLMCIGCASTKERDQTALIDEVQRTVPVCRESKECEIKWAAARDWAIKNSGRNLLQATNDYLETSNPVSSSEESIKVRVVREPQLDGSFRIAATVWCASYIACVPDKWVALKSFNDTVNASWHPALAQ